MEFDVVLPVSLFIIVTITTIMYHKLVGTIQSLFEETKFGKREVVLLVSIMGFLGTAIAFMPSQAIQILYITSLSILLFSFTYTIVKKWYAASVPPVFLLVLYFLYWDNLLFFNLFAVTLACIITLYLGTLFSWKTTVIFAALITMLDVLQVFGTGFMGQAAEKMLELKLPVLIILPTYPIDGYMALGLGDVFLAGLLSLQMTLRLGYQAGILTALIISMATFFYEVIAINTAYFTYFPATVIIIVGWLAGYGAVQLISITRPK